MLRRFTYDAIRVQRARNIEQDRNGIDSIDFGPRDFESP